MKSARRGSARGLPNTGSRLAFRFGAGGVGYVPVTGDWDANGTGTVGVYQPGTGTFFLRNTNASGPADLAFSFGPTGAMPVVGDWDGQ
jgi:hypothetical protein